MKLSVLKTIFLIGIHILMNFESGAYAIPVGDGESQIPLGDLPGVLTRLQNEDGGHLQYLERGGPLTDVLDIVKGGDGSTNMEHDKDGSMHMDHDKDGSMHMDHDKDGSMHMDHDKGGSMNTDKDGGMETKNQNSRGSKVKHNKKSKSCKSGSNGLLLKLFLGFPDGSELKECGCSKEKGHSKGSHYANDGNEQSGGSKAEHGEHNGGGNTGNKGSGGGKQDGGKQDGEFSSGKYEGVGDQYTGKVPIHDAPPGTIRRTGQEINSYLAKFHHFQNEIGEKLPDRIYKNGVNPFLSQEHVRIYDDLNILLALLDFLKLPHTKSD